MCREMMSRSFTTRLDPLWRVSCHWLLDYVEP